MDSLNATELVQHRIWTEIPVFRQQNLPLATTVHFSDEWNRILTSQQHELHKCHRAPSEFELWSHSFLYLLGFFWWSNRSHFRLAHCKGTKVVGLVGFRKICTGVWELLSSRVVVLPQLLSVKLCLLDSSCSCGLLPAALQAAQGDVGLHSQSIHVK